MPATEQIKIRRVEPSDIAGMVSARMDYLTEMQGERADAYQTELRQRLMVFFTEAISQGSFFALQAEKEGEIVSYGGMILKKIPGDFNRSTYLVGEILNMYTPPEHRRKGYSSTILKELLKEAKKLGVSKVALHCSKAGEPLYRKHGFADPLYPYLELMIDQ